MTLGVVREMTWLEGAHPEVTAAMKEAIKVLEGLGATVKEVSLKYAKYAVPLQLLTSDSDIASMMLKQWLRTRWHDLDVGTRTRLAAGCLIPAAVYHRAMRGRALVRREVLRTLDGVDALLCPTNLSPPGRIDATKETVDSPEAMQRKVILRRISAYPFSMANVPAIAVPAGYTQAGLPMSLQIAARPFAEETVFRVAHAFERATPWHQRHPDLAKLASAGTEGVRS
jgi:aspartyl-tRNA(Asn)/glutamyl-tRNA(Gln) amidotransferase subunit A